MKASPELGEPNDVRHSPMGSAEERNPGADNASFTIPSSPLTLYPEEICRCSSADMALYPLHPSPSIENVAKEDDCNPITLVRLRPSLSLVCYCTPARRI